MTNIFVGMSITSYNIGYGPKLISFNDSLSTEYALRLIPLGGYVAFPANVERDEVRKLLIVIYPLVSFYCGSKETGEITKQLDDPNLLQNRPPLQRLLVISAGIIANFLLTFLISLGVTSTSGVISITQPHLTILNAFVTVQGCLDQCLIMEY